MIKEIILIYLYRIVATLLLLSSYSVASASTVVYYNFDGNLNDSSGNANHGSFVGGTPTYVTGSSRSALSLDGTNEYLVIPNDVIRNQSDFTISVTFKALSGDRGGILGYQNKAATDMVNANNHIPIIGIDNAGKMRVELWTNSGGMALI